jgi:hypothetical protein
MMVGYSDRQMPRAIHIARFAALAGCGVLAAAFSVQARSQNNAVCSIGGTITSGRIPLPGVVVSLTTPDAQSIDLTSSATDGTYALKVPAAGQFRVRAELVAFTPIVTDVTVDEAGCRQRLDLSLTLASRAAAPGATPQPSASPAPAADGPARGRTQAAGRGRGQGRGAAPQQFQSLALLADQSGLARADDATAGDATAQAVLPPGFSPDTSAESVTSIGTVASGDSFFGSGGFGERFGATDADGLPGNNDGRGNGFGPGGTGAGGPGGGLAGLQGGFGAGGFGGRGRGGQQIRGTAFESVSTSALDAPPVALNGQPTSKPQYFQQRFGVTIGGPIAIPKIFDRARTFFFLNYTGNHARNPYDVYSTVPTLAERGGDLSALGGPVIATSRIDPAAKALLNLIPLPNQAGDRQNFHNVTTTTSNVDDINLRLVHMFGAPPQGRRGGGLGGGRGGGGAGGGRGGGGGRAGVSNLNIGVHYRHSDTTSQNPFPSLGGSSTVSAWDVPVNYSFTKASLFHAVRLQFNRNDAQTQNQYAFGNDIAAAAGIRGAASDPFDWGAPALSFSTFTGLRDVNPSMRIDQTIGIGDTIVKTHGLHTIRFGGDYRDIRTDSRSDANARGTFVFTGLYTGIDFGDFLVGLPQQATVQYGPGLEQFRQHTADLFIQDDWRARPTLTVNAGLRYEYFSPFSEADNRLVTLDASPGFTAAAPAAAGTTSPFSGALPDTIVRPFRRGFAPRLGVAWKARPATTVRAGYGINYSAGIYQSIAQQLAAQPPYAVTGTLLSTVSTPVPLESALATAVSASTTNTYGVDPNYRLGYVQIWNADVQHDVARLYNFGIGYTGTKGTNLDILRAPNRTPTGLGIAGVPPFIWESSEGDSIMHSLTLRARKRMTNGIGAGATYTLARSTDNASSIGGSGGVVAQNDLDLEAERGLSSFDQRHRFAADVTYELPFGAKKRWFTAGMAAAIFGGWQVNGNLQLASGTPFTARVLANISDVSRGTNGTLRANYDGAPVAISDPTAALFFNTAAFSVPAPGTFGTAGRNTIIGPGTKNLNMLLSRTVSFGTTRALTIQLIANNLLNTVQYAAIDTIVNSPTFGRVTAARASRRIQIAMRIRF